MLMRNISLISLLVLNTFIGGCSSNSLYSGVQKEARTFATPSPQETQFFPARPPFPTWTDIDEPYRFYPGDEIDIAVLGAPELNKIAVVAPDGRINANLAGTLMAADRTADEIRWQLQQRYSTQLQNPTVNIAPKSFASQKIFVGGEVAKPGIYEIPGELDPLTAVVLAGGFLNSAKREETVVLRRGAGGQPYMRMFNLKTVFAQENGFAQLPRLRRLDVVWVPRSRISEVGLFTQQFLKDALPITIGFNYQIGGRY
jgi:protein involved in polysaccharide export with SLBB domain